MVSLSPRAVWAAIRRGRLIPVVGAYLGGSFVALQLADIFTVQLGLPDWFFPGIVVLLVVGFPIFLTTALVQARPKAGEQEQAKQPVVTAPPRDSESAPGTAARGRHWLTWRKAILGVALALALWGVIVAGYMAMRVLGIGPAGSLVAAGVLDPRERIILADFENRTSDPLLADAVTEALRVDLSQSPLFTLVPSEQLNRVLARMKRDPDAALDLGLARELAIREGVKAVLAGEVSAVGGSFVLSGRLVSAEDGTPLAAYRETAQDSTGLLPAIDRLSKRFRERIGESLKTIRASKPLPQVTTASLEALRKYSQAIRLIEEGEAARGRALLQEAVELDTAFAMAWRKLGLVPVGRASEVEALTKAFQHRDRLTDRERYLTLGTYYAAVTEEREKAITAYSTLLDTYPKDSWALNNLALLYYEVRDFRRAEELLRRAIEADSFSLIAYMNLVEAQFALGKIDSAEATLGRFADQYPQHPRLDIYRVLLVSAQGNYDVAEALVRAFQAAYKGDVFRQLDAQSQLFALALVRGRLAQAERVSLDLLSLLEPLGVLGEQLRVHIALGLLDVWFRGESERGLRKVAAALRRHPLEEIAPLDRPYLFLAQFYALAGKPQLARATLAQFDAAVDPELRRKADTERHGILAVMALVANRPQEAIAEFRRADEGACPICALPGLALAFEQAGQPDSALSYYERYVNTPWFSRLREDMLFLGLAYERLGALYEDRGDREKAIRHYSRLVELWSDCDPELRPRVESAVRAIEALSPDRPGPG